MEVKRHKTTLTTFKFHGFSFSFYTVTVSFSITLNLIGWKNVVIGRCRHNCQPAEKVEMTTCFSICERRSLLARETLLCEQGWTDHKRVPKNNYIFEYPWHLVWWENTTRASLKKIVKHDPVTVRIFSLKVVGVRSDRGGPDPPDPPPGSATDLTPKDLDLVNLVPSGDV